MTQVILKPAESTPLTALALAELGHRAGIPNGVLNIVQGDAKAIGEPFDPSDLVQNDRIIVCRAQCWHA